MKKVIVQISLAVLVFNCSEKKTESNTGAGRSATFEVYNGDTINRMDVNGLKQGIWINFEHSTVTRIKDTVVYKDGEPVKK